MNEYFWELIQFDGTVIAIPPTAVEVIKRRWDNGDPIHLSTGSIPANQIKKFQITDRPFSSQPLLEAASQAFDEPMVSEQGNILGRWVKKNVTQEKYNKMYSNIPSYKYLGEFNGMTTVAFRVAVHDINSNTVEYCTEQELQQLNG